MKIDSRANDQFVDADMGVFFDLSVELLCIAGYDGYFKRLNPIWTRVIGFTLEELMAEPFLSFVHPDDREPTLVALQEARGAEFFTFKNRYRCRDGSYRLFDWSCAPAPERQFLCAVARDITEQMGERERLAHLLRASRVVLYSRGDGDSGATFISDNITDQFGYTPSEFLADAKFWADRVHPDDRQRASSGRAILFERGTYSQEYRFLHADGSYRWINDDAKLVRDDRGKVVEIVGSWQDITERRDAQDIIRRQASALTELSTPLIPISEDVVVMPLIGTMDSERANLVIETLLEGVSRSRASVAILDITGVSVVDTQVANALLRAAKAVGLLGAEVVLTGIRADVARTLVGLGVDLADIVTRGTLQSGIAYALERADAAQ
jgi:rsbT co-antagonist protein RsbR